MFGSVLGNFQGHVAFVCNRLLNAFDFIPEDEGVFLLRVVHEVLQHRRMRSLFHADDGIAFFFQPAYEGQCVLGMFPGNGELGTQG